MPHPSTHRPGHVFLRELAGGPALAAREDLSPEDRWRRRTMANDMARRGLVSTKKVVDLNAAGALVKMIEVSITDAGREALADADRRARARPVEPPPQRERLRGRTVGLAILVAQLQTIRPDGELARRSSRR